mgnify:CR=1 FL=1
MLRLVLATVICVLPATLAGAFEIESMSDQERSIFRSEIRDYLLENPEVLMEAIAILEQRRGQEAAQQELAMIEDNRDAIFNDGASFVGGNPDGDVTMVEFLDYRCGFCKRAYPAVEELIATDGNIRYIVKEFPILGEQSTLASSYALAVKLVAGDEDYKNIHDLLMTHNGNINAGFLARTSGKLGLDHDAVLGEMEGEKVAQIIADNRALGATLQIQGTPSFIMGENFVRGFVELDQMRAIIDDIRNNQG